MFLSSCTPINKNTGLVYIGSYTPKGEGIYVYRFNRKDYSFQQVQVINKDDGIDQCKTVCGRDDQTHV